MRDFLQGVRSLRNPLLLATAAAVTLHSQLAADTFGSGANQFDIDFVPIGSPGNPADTTGLPNPAGSVPYGYRMGTYEVSRDMITKANAPVASGGGNLGITMADMSAYGGNGVNRPATGVTWYEAASFVNWLNASTGHQPAYKFIPNISSSGTTFALWTPNDPGYAAANPYRNSQALYFLPSEQEWYKSAYYSPGGVYYNFPTGTDSAPTAVASGTGVGTTVYGQPLSQGPADVENAGGLSPYGTMGQGGNVFEWMEGAFDGGNDSPSEFRGWRGGSWDGGALYLDHGTRAGIVPSVEVLPAGFRVAAVPEPLESAGVIGVAAFGFALWRRRGSLWSFFL